MPYRMVGLVQSGAGQGRKLGFPTANLALDPNGADRRIPQGVFAARARWDAGPEHPAVANIGHRPTFGQNPLTVEVHILDFSGDLYGKPLEVELIKRLRAEQRFASIEELIAQIEKDIGHTRELLQ